MAREYPLRTNAVAGRKYSFRITLDASGDPSAVVPSYGVCAAVAAHAGKYTLTFKPALNRYHNVRVNVIKDADSSTVAAYVRSVVNSAGSTVVTFQLQSAAGTDAKVATCEVCVEVELAREYE